MAKVVWKSVITSDMTRGWSAEKIQILNDELNDAVETIFSDLEAEFDEEFDPDKEED
jgi:hypothetical protein